MHVSLNILKNHPLQPTPSILFQVNQKKYLFNICENFNRFLYQTKEINNYNGFNIFLTNLHYENFSGLFPFLFTMSLQKMGKDTKIYAPSNFINYLDKIKFLMGTSLLGYSFYGIDVKYDERFLRLGINNKDEILIRFKESNNPNLKEIFSNIPQNDSNIKLNNASSHFLKQENIFQDGFITVIPIIIKSDSKDHISYVVIIDYSTMDISNEILRKNKVNELTYSYFKNLGEVFVNKNERIFARNFPDLNKKSDVFFILDVPSIEIFKKLKENHVLETYASQNLDSKKYNLKSIMHLTSPNIYNDAIYREFMDKFNQCEHLFFPSNQPTDRQRNFRHHKLTKNYHKYFHKQFPGFHHLNNKTTSNECLNIPSVFKNQHYFDFKKNAFVNFILYTRNNFHPPKNSINFDKYYTEFAKFQNHQVKNELFSNYNPFIRILGTASAFSSEFRNTTSIYINISEDNKHGMLLDCGDGTFYQLYDQFGPDKIDQILIDLNIIYISHFHFDHHLGIFEVLRKRKDALKRLNISPLENPLFLLIPKNLSIWIHNFLAFIEKIDNFHILFTSELCMNNLEHKKEIPSIYKDSESLQYMNIASSDGFEASPNFSNCIKLFNDFLALKNITTFKTIRTNHCSESHALIFEHKDNIKIAYSGDTRPCLDLINHAKNATLLIHEATFLNDQDAKESSHCSISETIDIVRKVKPWRTIITHFSGKNDNFQISRYSGSDEIVVARDHMRMKLGDLEFMPKINDCLYYLHERDNNL